MAEKTKTVKVVPFKRFNLLMTVEQKKFLKQASKETGKTQCELIRNALDQFINKSNKKK